MLLAAFFALATSTDAFATLDQSPALRGATATPMSQSFWPSQDSKLILSRRYTKSSWQPKWIEVVVLKLPSVNPQLALKNLRMGISAATVPFPMKELDRYGFKTNYIGQPSLIELDHFQRNTLIAIRVNLGQQGWTSRGMRHWQAEVTRRVTDDKKLVKMLQLLEADLDRRSRVQKVATQPSE